MQKFKNYLTEVEVKWSREYEGLDSKYIVESMKEGEQIYYALMKYLRNETNDRSVDISHLPVNAILKKKYKGISIGLTYNPLSPGLTYDKVNTLDKFTNADKFKTYKNIKDLKPDFKIFSPTKGKVSSGVFGTRDQFISNWVEFKRELYSNVLYKKVTERLSTQTVYDLAKWAVVGATAIAVKLLFNVPLPVLPIIAGGTFYATGFFANHFEARWFANDKLEVEKQAVDFITDRARLRSWNAEWFTKWGMGPEIVSKEEFIEKMAGWRLFQFNKMYLLSKDNLQKTYSILYDAYVETMKKQLYTEFINPIRDTVYNKVFSPTFGDWEFFTKVKEAALEVLSKLKFSTTSAPEAIWEMLKSTYSTAFKEIANNPTSYSGMHAMIFVMSTGLALSVPAYIIINYFVYRMRLNKVKVEAAMAHAQKISKKVKVNA